MPVKEFLWPVKVEGYNSKFNQEIEIMRFMGDYRLDMGGLTQSGDIIKRIWRKAFKKLLPKDFVPKRVLILGLGAGSVAEVISKRWPETKIVGVEIDPVVISIGRKYFSLDKIPNLMILNQDAVKYVEGLDGQRFDLILVDCYQGYKIPAKLETLTLAKKLKSHGDFVLFNRLFWDKHQRKSLNFKKTLEQEFDVVQCRTPSNLVLGLEPKLTLDTFSRSMFS